MRERNTSRSTAARLDRALDDGVEVERLVRDPQRPDVLAPAELLDAQLERLDHAQARLAVLETHLSRGNSAFEFARLPSLRLSNT